MLRPVQGVAVRGLTVAQFPHTGILTFGADGTRIERTDIAGGISYGILLAHSSDSLISASRVHGGQTAGIYIGDSPDARTMVVDTEVFDNPLFGIFVRNAAHGRIARNVIRDNCVGVGFMATQPDPATISDWTVTTNHIRDNNRFCALGVEPRFAAIGVLIAGGTSMTVTHNAIIDSAPPAGAPPTRGGGVVMTGDNFGGPHPTGNRIQANLLRGNKPYDLNILDEGTGNRLSGNICRTSAPNGLCTR